LVPPVPVLVPPVAVLPPVLVVPPVPVLVDPPEPVVPPDPPPQAAAIAIARADRTREREPSLPSRGRRFIKSFSRLEGRGRAILPERARLEYADGTRGAPRYGQERGLAEITTSSYHTVAPLGL
jgi:hypothetical protein